MFPILVIAIGIAVLVFGKRLAVLGAAVGALLGVGLLSLFSTSGDPLLQLAVVGLAHRQEIEMDIANIKKRWTLLTENKGLEQHMSIEQYKHQLS